MKRSKKPNYKAWDIDENDFPKDGTIEDKIKFLIGYGILAPSTHNTQPWIFDISSNVLRIDPDLGYKLPEADTMGRNLYISIGACLSNILAAARYFGFDTEFKIGKNKKTTNVEIAFKPSKSKTLQKDVHMFKGIKMRYSEKRVTQVSLLSRAEWRSLLESSPSDFQISFTNNRTTISELANQVYEAAASYEHHPAFGRELAGWMRTNKSKRFDGMTGQPSGLTTGKVVVGKTLMRRLPKSMRVFAKKYLEQTNQSSGLGLISSENDDPEAWIITGKLYEDLAITAAYQKISLGPMAALIETHYRNKLPNFFKDSNKFPQMFFRLVKVKGDAIHSPRREQPVVKYSGPGLLASLVNADLKDKFVSLDKLRIHYVTSGKGVPILLLHGANTGWGQWYPNIDDLSRSYKVYALDLPGSGQSSHINFRTADFKKDYVDTVYKFITSENLRKIYLVGHSFGAAVAARLAIEHPDIVDKLVLLNPLGLTEKVPAKQLPITSLFFARLLSKTVMRPNSKNMKSFLESGVFDKSVIRPEFVDHYLTFIDKESHPMLFMNGQTRGLKFNPEMLFINELKDIKQPTFVVLGSNDPLLPSHKIATLVRKIKNVKLKMFKDTGHVTSLEQSTLFNNEVLNFLKK